MSVETVRQLAAGLGVDVEAVVFSTEPGVVPQAPSHRWVVLTAPSGASVIGGTDRGDFAAYASFDDDEVAARALAQLAAGRAVAGPESSRDTLRDAVTGAVAVLHGIGPAATAADLPVGTPLDHIGTESGHVLTLLDTPVERRSLPPTDLQQRRTGYVLAGVPPRGVRLETAVPWFGQPGGALLVVLDRVIAYYVDAGLLRPFAVDS